MTFGFGEYESINIDKTTLTDPSGTDYILLVVAQVTVTPESGTEVIYNLAQEYTELPTESMVMDVAYRPIKGATISSDYKISYTHI